MELLKRLARALFVTAVILLALIMGGMRLVISNIDLFDSEIAYLLERDVSKGIVLVCIQFSVIIFYNREYSMCRLR